MITKCKDISHAIECCRPTGSGGGLIKTDTIAILFNGKVVCGPQAELEQQRNEEHKQYTAMSEQDANSLPGNWIDVLLNPTHFNF